eukprot:UC1_evm1s1122
MWQLMRNPSVLLLVLAGGIEGGGSSGWSGVLTSILSPPAWDPKFVAWLGFFNLLAGVVGNFVSGWVGDLCFRRRLKAPIVVFFFWAAAAYAWFAFTLPTPWSAAPLLPTSHDIVLAAIVLSGFVQGAIDPCLYELAAELSYPQEESASAMLITLAYNAATLVVLCIAPNVPSSCMNIFMVGAMLLCGLLCCGVRERYIRTAAEATMARTRSASIIQ